MMFFDFLQVHQVSGIGRFVFHSMLDVGRSVLDVHLFEPLNREPGQLFLFLFNYDQFYIRIFFNQMLVFWNVPYKYIGHFISIY